MKAVSRLRKTSLISGNFLNAAMELLFEKCFFCFYFSFINIIKATNNSYRYNKTFINTDY